MRLNLNTVNAADIFPLMGVFGGVAVSVKGTFTIGWKLTLPKVFHQTEEEYDDLIETFASAIRVLPAWTVVHRQDLYTYRTYEGDPDRTNTYLEQCYQKHFKGRKYLDHEAYLFLSIGSKEAINKDSSGSGLFGINGSAPVPTEAELDLFRSKSGEFIQILTSGGRLGAELLESDNDWLGSGANPGIIQRIMMLGNSSSTMSDIQMGPDFIEAYDKHAQAYVIGESSSLPSSFNSVTRVDAMSSIGSEIFLSSGSRLGVQLDCEHMVNHYVIIPPQQATTQGLEKKLKEMTAGISSNDNRLNAEEISEYLDEVYKNGLLTVYAHLNVIAWGEKREKAEIGARISAALTAMGVTSVYNKHNTPILYYAAIPSNGFEIGMENLMTMEIHSALAMGCYETFDNGLGEGDIVLCDRVRNTPVRLDVDEVSARRGLNNNYNKFILGGSGTGKSFTMNRLLTCEHNAGASVFGLDVGDSYEGPTYLIRELTGGRDGQYNSWSKDNPLTFNPFKGFEDWIDATGQLQPDDTGVNAFISLLETMWKPSVGWTASTESILKQMIHDFVKSMQAKGYSNDNLPLFDDFYHFVNDVVKESFDARLEWVATKGDNEIKKAELEHQIIAADSSKSKKASLPKLQAQLNLVTKALEEKGYTVGTDKVGYEDFDLKNFHLAMKAYSLSGEFNFFLNDKHPKDLVSSRWVFFELDKLSQVNDKKFYSLCVLEIMHAFDLKMRETSGRKILIVDEAWKAIANETMAPYLKSLWKTARKFSTSAIVVTQEITDITSSDVIKDAILANSDIRILLDQSNNRNILLDEKGRGDDNDIRKLLGLTPKDISLILSMNKVPNKFSPHSRECFIKYVNGTSTVVSVEVSPEEAIAYESNHEKKKAFLTLAKQTGSYVEAIEKLIK